MVQNTGVQVTGELTKPAARPAASDVLRPLRAEMDRLFDRFADGFGVPSLRGFLDVMPAWQGGIQNGFAAPAVDIIEDDAAYHITAELPGMSEKDVDVSVDGDTLVLKGEKRQEREEKEKNRYLSERSYGAFQRSFTLPKNVERDKIAAVFAKGVLKVDVPKSAEARTQQRKVEVKVA